MQAANALGLSAGQPPLVDIGRSLPEVVVHAKRLQTPWWWGMTQQLLDGEMVMKGGQLFLANNLPLSTGAVNPTYAIESTVLGGIATRGVVNALGFAAKGVTNTVTRSESVLGHIFRNKVGHVNPSTVTSQGRYINLFEKVANNSANLNPNVLNNFQRTAGSFQGHSQIFRNGRQVWTQSLNGKIFDAGVNIIPK